MKADYTRIAILRIYGMMVIMEMYHLHSFIAVANEGKLTQAAKHINTSQPAVSMHITTLEKELGVILFIRSPRGMSLTKEGRILKAQAEKCLESVNELFHQAKRLKGVLSGVVKIGLNSNSSALRVNELLSLMGKGFPRLDFQLLRSDSWITQDKLRKGSLDFGYIYGEVSDTDIESIFLETRKLVVVGPSQWKEKLKKADWKELTGFPWIFAYDKCPFFTLAHEIFSKQKCQPSKIIVADEDTILTNLVSSGFGLSLMAADDVPAVNSDKPLCVWEKDHYFIDLFFAYLKKRKTDPEIQAVLKSMNSIWHQ